MHGSIRYQTVIKCDPIGNKVEIAYIGSFVALYNKYDYMFYNNTSIDIDTKRMIW